MNYVVIVFIFFSCGFFVGWQQHKEFSESLGIRYENIIKFDEKINQ